MTLCHSGHASLSNILSWRKSAFKALSSRRSWNSSSTVAMATCYNVAAKSSKCKETLPSSWANKGTGAWCASWVCAKGSTCPHPCGVDKFQLPLAPPSTSECFPAGGGWFHQFNSFSAGLPNYIARKHKCVSRCVVVASVWFWLAGCFMLLCCSQCQLGSPCQRTKWFTHAANPSNKHEMDTLKNPMVPPISQGALPVPDANLEHWPTPKENLIQTWEIFEALLFHRWDGPAKRPWKVKVELESPILCICKYIYIYI